MKLLIIFFTTFVFINIVNAQVTLPIVIKPSPQITSFQKYGEYPVSYNTGVPDISIPLYNIQSDDVQMPIVLRYHASGIKPYEPDLSNIGAGWILDVGGLISRTVKGTADELKPKPNPFLTGGLMDQQTYLDNPNLSPSLQVDQNTYDGNLYLNPLTFGGQSPFDIEHDQFNYSFSGRSGKFVIDNIGNGEFPAYSYPFVPYKFDVQTNAPINSQDYRSISGINITDDKGFTYKFGHSNIETVVQDALPRAATGWFLEDIENSANNNLIHLSYVDIPEFLHTRYTTSVSINGDQGRSIIFGRDVSPDFPSKPSYGYPQYSNLTPSNSTYKTKSIDRIVFKGGYIQFSYSDDKKLLQSFAIYDNNNQIIKSVVLNRDKFPGSSFQYRLNSIQVKNQSGNTVDQYDLGYDDLNPIPDSDPNSANNCSVDYWGYCRGLGGKLKYASRTVGIVYNRSSSSLSDYSTTIAIGDADFSAATDQTACRYILNRIKYPTGGTTVFSYEPNQYISGNLKFGGGLRIKNITSTDNMGQTSVKTYEYEPGFTEYSFPGADGNPITSYNVSDMRTGGTGGECHDRNAYIMRNRTFTNGTNGDVGDIRVYYKKITEYIGNLTSNSGKTIYSFRYDNPNLIGSHHITNSYYIYDFRNWGNGLLHSTEIFRNAGAGNYSKIKDITNSYTFNFIKKLYNFTATKAYDYSELSGAGPLSLFTFRNESQLCNGSTGLQTLPKPYELTDYTITTGAYNLSSTLENDYTNNSGIIAKQTNYLRTNPKNYYITEEEVSKSDGTIQITKNTYPQDITDAISVAMTEKNIISPVITKKIFKTVNNNQTLLSTLQTNYNQFDNLFLPASINSALGTDVMENRIQFNKYNLNGNILEQQLVNGVKECYLWSYNGQYPVAKIIGSDYAAITGLVSQSQIDNAANDEQNLRNILSILRTSLANAQVTTYTYKPLIGMTSQTDAKGMTYYYEYDAFQRLKYIKDQNRNIIKSFCYNYAGSPISCNDVVSQPVYQFDTGFSVTRSDLCTVSTIPSQQIPLLYQPIYSTGGLGVLVTLQGVAVPKFYLNPELTQLATTGYYTLRETRRGHVGYKLYYIQNGILQFEVWCDEEDPDIIPEEPAVGHP